MKELLAPIRGQLGLAVVFQIGAAITGILPFYAVAVLADRVLEPGPADRGAVWSPIIFGLIAALAALVLATAATTTSHLADARLQLSLRRDLVDRLGRVPLGWFSAKGSGTVAKVVRDDVHALHHLVAHSLIDAVGAVAASLTALVILAFVNPWLALLGAAPLVAGIVLFARGMAGSMAQFDLYNRAQEEINAGVVEFVNGIAVVKTFGGGRRAHSRFIRASRAFHEFFSNWAGRTERVTTASFLVVSAPVVLVLVLGVGGVLLSAGWCTGPELVAAALLAPPLAAPLATIGIRSQQIRTGATAAQSVADLLAEPVLPDPSAPASPSDATVRLEGVGFSYDGESPVLSGVDLDLTPGTVTALVGPSGAGKSTLALLVARFFDVTQGRITIGGVDIRDVDPRELSGLVGYVFQENGLPRLPVGANIRLGNRDAGDDEVVHAARVARIHDRIVADPAGYDAVVGEEVEFSGGEQQRIGIARAVLADTPILVLDEATAFADPESAALIQEGIYELAAGRTLLVIAHRLRTVVEADQIVVLDGGRIVERGTHTDLLARNGRYAGLWRAQEGDRS